MTETTGEGLEANGVDKKAPEKSIFQEIKEVAAKAWGKFKESMKGLWLKADEKLEPVNKKAGEISEKTKTESVKDYFRKHTESFKDGIRARSYDIYGGLYDIGAVVSQAKVMFWRNFKDGLFATYLGENQRNVKARKKKAKDYYAKAKEKAKENRGKRDKSRENAKEVREKKTVAV